MGIRMVVVEDENISCAWFRAFAALTEPGVAEISPLVVNIQIPAGTPSGDIPAVQRELDAALAAAGKPSCHTVANTIFPLHLWRRDGNRDDFFRRYLTVRQRQRRRRGFRESYFDRLIAFGPEGGGRNQLDYIISTFRRGNHRRSALQASVFDPRRDQTDQRQRGFPCLQQVSFMPQGDGGFCVTGFYAMQYIFNRAYGNYLGLCRLGDFVAQELGYKLTKMVCIAAVAQLGTGISKTAAQTLADRLSTVPGIAQELGTIIEPSAGGQL